MRIWVLGTVCATTLRTSSAKNCLVVIAHPNTNRSLNHELAGVAATELTSLCRVRLVDLVAIDWTDGHGGRDDFTSMHDAQDFEYGQEQAHAARGGLFSHELRTQMELVRWADLIVFQWPVYWSARALYI